MTIIASAQSALTDSAVSSLDDDSREQPPGLTNPHTFGKAILCRKSSVRATQLENGDRPRQEPSCRIALVLEGVDPVRA